MSAISSLPSMSGDEMAQARKWLCENQTLAMQRWLDNVQPTIDQWCIDMIEKRRQAAIAAIASNTGQCGVAKGVMDGANKRL